VFLGCARTGLVGFAGLATLKGAVPNDVTHVVVAEADSQVILGGAVSRVMADVAEGSGLTVLRVIVVLSTGFAEEVSFGRRRRRRRGNAFEQPGVFAKHFFCIRFFIFIMFLLPYLYY
jgi:hypothetical protein